MIRIAAFALTLAAGFSANAALICNQQDRSLPNYDVAFSEDYASVELTISGQTVINTTLNCKIIEAGSPETGNYPYCTSTASDYQVIYRSPYAVIYQGNTLLKKLHCSFKN
jgi:hypothetical protein